MLDCAGKCRRGDYDWQRIGFDLALTQQEDVRDAGRHVAAPEQREASIVDLTVTLRLPGA